MIAVAPKIVPNPTPAKGGDANSATNTASGKSFSGVLQEATQNCQSQAAPPGGTQDNGVESPQPAAIHPKTGRGSIGSRAHNENSDQSQQTTPDSSGKTAWLFPANLLAPTAQPQPTDTTFATGWVSAAQPQDSEDCTDADPAPLVGVASTSSIVASPLAAAETPSMSPVLPAASNFAASTVASSTSAGATKIEEFSVQAPATEAPADESTVESVGTASLQPPTNFATQLIDLSSAQSVKTSIQTEVETEAPPPTAQRGPSTKAPVSATALPINSSQQATTNLKPGENLVTGGTVTGETVTGLPPHHSEIVSSVADGRSTTQTHAATAVATNSTQVLPLPESTNVADGRSTTQTHAATAVATNSTQVLPLPEPMNASSKAQSPVEGIHDAANSGAAAPAVAELQPAAAMSNKNADASGNGNDHSKTNHSSVTFSVGTAVDSQAEPSGANTAARPADVLAPSAGPAPVQASHVTSGGDGAPTTSPNGNAHLDASLPSTSAAITEAENHADVVAASANSLLHSARLVERIGQAELRVGVQTEEFGNVDIRTSMVRSQVTAQISVERPELGKVLAAELPSLQNRLSEQRLPAASITLENQSSGSAGYRQGSRQSQTMQQIAVPTNSETEPVPASVIFPEASATTNRLDVHM